MMTKVAIALCLWTGLGFAHTAESAGAAPVELAPPVAGLLQKDGIRIKDGTKTVMELWFRSSPPSGAKSAEQNITMPDVPHGSLMGVVRFTERGQDRRGQAIKPGIYTLRYSYFPANGDHQGASPQRDFLIMSPVAEDKDVSAAPDFPALMAMSMKASGTPHPAVLSTWKLDSAAYKGGVVQDGETDWVLETKIGEMPVAVIVAGVFNH